MKEAELLSQIQGIFRRSLNNNLTVPNGDDGAVFKMTDQVIACADVAVEGVHFNLEWSSYFEIGRKITAANLADVCAMGGWPEFLLVTVVLGERHLSGALELAEGIAFEADLVGAEVIGGDLSKGREFSISITAIGQTKKPLLRAGAQVGERILVSSLPGLSAAGLSLLEQGAAPDSELKKRAIAQHKAPAIDYAKYRSAFDQLSSAIDVSDGLLVDLDHIASASDVGMELISEQLQMSELRELRDLNFLDWVLSGGEDHVLLGTSKSEIAGFIEIGRVVAGSGIRIDGEEVSAVGYAHDWQV